nr:dolichyl-diphosphooligosaccharide--protein glycosyltransferase subunit 4A [Tanacetum cinerariifolium]
MITDGDLGFIANFMGIFIFALVIAYHYTRTFALGDKPHSFFAPEGKPPRRGLNPRPLACGNNLPKVTLGGHLS